MAAKKVVKKAAKAAKAVKPSKTAKVVKAAKAAKPTKAVKPVKKAAKAAAKAKSGALKQVASALAKALKPAAKVSKPKATAKPSKPAAKAAKPAAKPAKPVAKPAKPVAKAAKPVAKPAKPVAKPAKPAAKPAKPAAKPVKPAAKPAKPAAKASKPAAKVAAKTHDKSSIKTSSPADAGGQQSNAGKQAVSKQISAVAKPPAARRTGAVGIASPPGAIKPMPVKGKIVPKYKTDTTGRPIVPEGYRPSADEEFMNPLHLEYFRTRLLQWREDLVEESKQTIENLREEVRDVGDEAERATRETENSLELRTRDRYRKLIGKIDDALKRVEDGSYGWCVDTGEEIGLERLDARLTAERTIDAQERWEHRQRQMGD
ncbi:MAG: RNA polymerase-binding protein DksA [Gammaproteobacteria bacterium HGW-Gammaproteobacteria-2]|nr:MAG: RNA polymerase-binding protein DksA [Gammaproteobacteria bacterium HGW-Gammaproteobacteria-2]